MAQHSGAHARCKPGDHRPRAIPRARTTAGRPEEEDAGGQDEEADEALPLGGGGVGGGENAGAAGHQGRRAALGWVVQRDHLLLLGDGGSDGHASAGGRERDVRNNHVGSLDPRLVLRVDAIGAGVRIVGRRRAVAAEVLRQYLAEALQVRDLQR